MRTITGPLMGLWAGLNELVFIKPLEQCLIHSECYLHMQVYMYVCVCVCVCVCICFFFFPLRSENSESVSCSVSVTHGLEPARFLCPWDSPGKNTGLGCHSLLQGIFLTQGSNPVLLHCRRILYCLSHQGSHPLQVS